MTGSSGRIRDVVYVGSVTRYVVELDGGGTLTVVRQNLEDFGAETTERGRRVDARLAAGEHASRSRSHEYGGGGRMNRISKRHGSSVAAAAWSALLDGRSSASAPWAAGAKTGGRRALKMIAWDGYLDVKWVKPFEKQTGCKIAPKDRGNLGRDVQADAVRNGGSQYDMVSASGDASLRLIYGGADAAGRT